MSETTDLSVKELEDRLNRVTNLLAMWKARAKDSGWLGGSHEMWRMLVICTNELESALKGKE